jgi:hypothetical protein
MLRRPYIFKCLAPKSPPQAPKNALGSSGETVDCLELKNLLLLACSIAMQEKESFAKK